MTLYGSGRLPPSRLRRFGAPRKAAPTSAIVLAVAVIGSLAIERPLAQGDALAATRRATTAGPAPRTATGGVDLSGIWNPDRRFIYDINDALKPGETLPLQPWALKLTLDRLSKDDPEAHCLPTGVPRQAPYPWRIVQTTSHIFFLFEGNIHSYRQIFVDGRKHPADPNPQWYGHSVGRWEGDTLVVETIGFNERFWFDFAGHPHTDKMRTTERFRRPDANTLDYEVTIDDPGAYTRPFTLYGRHDRPADDEELMEYICNENAKDISRLVGKDPRNKYSKEKP